MRRRAFLSTTALAFAGCGGLGSDAERETRTARTGRDGDGRTTETASASTPRRAVRVTNDTPSATYVSVVVADGETTRYIRSGEVPAGEARSFGGIAVGPGAYEVIVETADGRRATRAWRVGDGGAELAARVGPEGVRLLREVVCELDCPPVSRGGTTAWDERPAARGSIELRNEGDDARTIRLELRRDRNRLAAYEYAVPAATTVTVPAYGRGSGYRVVVERGGERRTFAWGVGDGERLYVDVGETDARFRCGWRNRDLRVVNEDDVSHRLDVAVTTDGTTLFEETYELDAGAETLDPSVVENAGQYEFRIRSDRGEEASYVWNVCPPRGPVWVVVDEEGVQVSVRPR